MQQYCRKAIRQGEETMVERRAEGVKKQLKKRFLHIEHKFGDETKPFDAYYRSNYGGGKMPITFGRYGEINEKSENRVCKKPC